MRDNIYIPEHFQCAMPNPVFKAFEDGGKRFVWMETQDESLDLENEQVLQKALVEQRDYFLAKGNIDIAHWSKLPPNPNRPNPRYYEIGQPTDVVFDHSKRSTLVKATIYKGSDTADWFWKTLQSNPPMKWYPSIGGSTLHKSVRQIGGQKVGVVEKMIWSNIGLTQEPINQGVPPIQTIPFGLFLQGTNQPLSIHKSLGTVDVAAIVPEDLEGAYPQTSDDWVKDYNENKESRIRSLMASKGISREKAESIVNLYYSLKLEG